MEYEAECFMITELVKIYISLADIDIHQFNFMIFIEQNDLGIEYEGLIKQVAYEYAYKQSYG
ncbi:hypothetical protein ID741_002037 [Enterococcus sp. AZ103]